jgi:hypothetical protein
LVNIDNGDACFVADRLGIGKAEGSERSPDPLEGRLGVRFGRLRGDDPGKIGNVVSPDARLRVVALGAVDRAIVFKKRCRGDAE